MAAPGLATIELAKETGTWSALEAVDRLEEPADSRRTRRRARRAQALGRVPSLHAPGDPEWITTAKREATRAGRVAETVELAAENLRASDWPRPKASGKRRRKPA